MKTMKLMATTALCALVGVSPALAQVTALGEPEAR